MENSIRNQNHLILGAAGALGYGHVKALLERGARVTALVRYAEQAHMLFGEHENLDVAVGDIYDRAQMRRLARGKDFIFQTVSTEPCGWHNPGWSIVHKIHHPRGRIGATHVGQNNSQ